MLDKSAGWDRLVDLAEEKIAKTLNGVLNPEEGINGLIKILMNLGEIKGMQGFSKILETEVEMAREIIDVVSQQIAEEPAEEDE